MTKKEARLLHFSRTDKPPTNLSFHLSHPTSKGLPIDIPLERTYTETKMLSEQYESGLMEAITEVVGEGGDYGWVVRINSLFFFGFLKEGRGSDDDDEEELM